MFRPEQRRPKEKGILQTSPGTTGTEINKNEFSP
jgi:hypothetical protein